MDDKEKAKVLEKTDMHKSTFKTLLNDIDDRAMELYGLDTSLLNEILGLDGSKGNDIPAAQVVIEDEKDEIDVVEDEDAEANHLYMDDNPDSEDLDDYDEDENEYVLDDENEDDLPHDNNQLRNGRLYQP